MKISEVVEPRSTGRTTLGQLATVRVKFPEADFWIQRRGDNIGTVHREFSPEHIGVKVTATDVLDPGYLRHVIEYLRMRGYFKMASGGMIMPHIQVNDVKKIPLGLSQKAKPVDDYSYKKLDYQINPTTFKE